MTGVPIMTLTLIAITAVLFIIGTPIGVSLGLASIISMVIYKAVPNLIVLPQLFGESATSFTMLAVPLFILAGNLMEGGTIGRKLIRWVDSFTCWLTGGLGIVNIVASMVFGGISGSSLADTATFGTLLVPMMTEEGYDRDYSGAITMTTSTLSVIIPPSLLMVLAAAAAQQSVARALAAGFGAGVFLTLMFCVPNYIISKKKGFGIKRPFSMKYFLQMTAQSSTAIMAPLIILVSIFTGWVTPTEAAGIAVLYILLVDGVFSRNLPLKKIWECCERTAEQTSAILFIATSGAVLIYILNIEGIPKLLEKLLTSVPGGKYGYLFVIIIIMILIGMVMDASPAALIFAPLFMPSAAAAGVDPSHFLIILVFGLALGLSTPPYGVCIFSTANITKIPMHHLIKAAVPFYIVMIITYFIVAYFPPLTLTIPKLLGM